MYDVCEKAYFLKRTCDGYFISPYAPTLPVFTFPARL
jgi:hypothetical protein